MVTTTATTTTTPPPLVTLATPPPPQTTASSNTSGTTTFAEVKSTSPRTTATEAILTPPMPANTTTTDATPPSTSSASNRDVEDGKHYCSRKSHFPPCCKTYAPTLEELQKTTFSDYIRQVVLAGARVRVSFEDDVKRNQSNGGSGEVATTSVHYIEDMELNENGFPSRPPLFAEGMAKVTLPDGFWKEEGIGKDRTGRGPAWQKGTPLGDLVIPNPIKQCVRGIGGVYEYTLMDQPPIALHAFREQADAYLEEQLFGKVVKKKKTTSPKKKKTAIATTRKTKNSNKRQEEEKKDEVEEENENNNVNTTNGSDDDKKEEDDEKQKLPTVEELERKFWKRLGPTMPPATYGADMEGSLFGDDPANGWNLSQLDTFLQLLGPNLPGVTSPYLYFGMWAACFAAHTEDMNLLSINYLHAGAPKIWYAIAPGPDARRMEALCEHYFAHAHQDCKQFLRHKRSLLSPMILKKAGIKYTTMVQYPGEVMITIPGGYHFGFNVGFNVAEATNFGVPEWIPFGHEARICMCRPDSVRIDMFRLERLYARYMKENRKKTSRRRKSFREWGMLYFKAHNKVEEEESESESDSEDENRVDNNNNNKSSSKRARKKDFWVEVMAPVPSAQRADYGRRGTSSNQNNKNSNINNKSTPQKRSRSGKGQQQQPRVEKEVWHLAKPMTRKGLVVNAKVLVMIPGRVTSNEIDARNHYCDSSDSSDSDESSEEDDEQCFAGIITEFSDDYCRVHFERLPKDDDVWMHIDSSKLFLDGGAWDEAHEVQGLPPKHFWQEMDSKRRCL